MSVIQSLDDLHAARAQALEDRRREAAVHPVQVMVGMSTCGIAAGAAAIWQIFEQHAPDLDRSGQPGGSIRLIPTGCIGLCALEPIVQVQIVGQPLITYGKVTPDVARRILSEHIGKGFIVASHQVENV